MADVSSLSPFSGVFWVVSGVPSSLLPKQQGRHKAVDEAGLGGGNAKRAAEDLEDCEVLVRCKKG